MKLKQLMVPMALVGILSFGAFQVDAYFGKVNLTETQQATLQEMRDDGASRAEVKAQFENWSIEAPERREHRRGGMHNNIFEQLSDTQKEALKELKTNGADRSDIHEQLADWGIEIPEPPFFSELSDDQKETLKEMREDGADREEIKAQLEDWGIDLPERGSKK